MFHNWRYAVQMKRQREILEGMPREGDGKATLRDVFMAWYAQSQRNRAQRAAQAASDNKTFVAHSSTAHGAGRMPYSPLTFMTDVADVPHCVPPGKWTST